MWFSPKYTAGHFLWFYVTFCLVIGVCLLRSKKASYSFVFEEGFPIFSIIWFNCDFHRWRRGGTVWTQRSKTAPSVFRICSIQAVGTVSNSGQQPIFRICKVWWEGEDFSVMFIYLCLSAEKPLQFGSLPNLKI